jgi:hypothetical protein
MVIENLPSSIQVRHLAYAGDRPTICMMQCMANFAFFNSAWIGTGDIIKTIGTAMLFNQSELDFGLAARSLFLLWTYRRLFYLFDRRTISII